MIFRNLADSLPEFSIHRDLNLCIGCGVCIGQCSYGAHQHKEYSGFVHHNLLCRGCRRCEAMCPAGAISIIHNEHMTAASDNSFYSSCSEISIRQYYKLNLDLDSIHFKADLAKVIFQDDSIQNAALYSKNLMEYDHFFSIPILFSLSGKCFANYNYSLSITKAAESLSLPYMVDGKIISSDGGQEYILRIVKDSCLRSAIEQIVEVVKRGSEPVLCRSSIDSDYSEVDFIIELHKELTTLNIRHRCLIIATGCGVKSPADFLKLILLGADAVDFEFPVLKELGCTGCQGCNENLCPWGLAATDDTLVKRLNPEQKIPLIKSLTYKFMKPVFRLKKNLKIDSIHSLKGRMDLLSFPK